ncbi:MacS family sensor histidine kinase [Actinophytocola xanthii]|uniref:MacS family sensor histidine kinase n=1 Tax=Actinophytocola xanthii TaxID=1912961 RepID=UPI0038B7242C
MTGGAPEAGVPEAKDPTTPLWRAAVLLRVLTLVFAAGVVVVHVGEYARPWLALVAIGLMAVWTAAVTAGYLRPAGRRLGFTVADLVVSCATMCLSPLVLTPAQLAGGQVPLITTVWVTGVVAAGAVCAGPAVGAGFGAVVAAFNYGVRGYVDTDLTRDLILLVGVGFVLGLAASTSRRSAERLEQALRAEAATAERERLARSIHDSVLQVLARVRRRGAELGGEAAELARLAGEQEIALRALVSTGSVVREDGTVDLGARLRLLATDRVEVSVPATAVRLPVALAGELEGITREALTNVANHAGPAARAWVLLEDLGDEVVLSVRDDGVGIPPGRLDEAEREGRMGVALSMRGRVAGLGGTIAVETAPGAGVEWELRVPRPGARVAVAR